MRVAVDILKGRKVSKSVRTLIIPGTRDVYLQMEKEGMIRDFVEAGAIVSPPTCGPCLGGHMGILAEGDLVHEQSGRIAFDRGQRSPHLVRQG